MNDSHPADPGRRVGNDFEPLAVSPRQACLLLGIGNTRLYQLLGAGELASYNEGRARRITTASIRERVARLAGASDNGEPPRPRGRRARSSSADQGRVAA
jgi:excisionase family DNA binding protein